MATLDTNGSLLWSRRFGDAANQTVTALAILPNHAIALAGSFQGSVDVGTGALISAGQNDILLAEFTSVGSALWAKRFGDASDQLAGNLAVDRAGNLGLVASIAGSADFGGGLYTSRGGYDGVLMTFGSQGAFVWGRSAGDASDQRATGVYFTPTGNLVVAGSFQGSMELGGATLTSAGGHDIFIAQFASSGAHVWSKRFGDSAEQTAQAVIESAAGGHVLLGANSGVIDFGGGALRAAGSQDIALAVFNDVGALVSARGYGISGAQLGAALAPAPRGAAVYLTGFTTGSVDFGSGVLSSAGLEDAFITQISP